MNLCHFCIKITNTVSIAGDLDKEYCKYHPLILCGYQKFSAEDLESALNMVENQRLCFCVQMTSR